MATAQVAIPDQPDSTYYAMVVNTCKVFTPTEYDIVNVKPNSIPATIADSLKKYDWYVIGTFGYTEGGLRLPFRKDKDQFDNDSYQFDCRRFCKDEVIGDFYLQKTTTGKVTLFTNTFDKNTAEKFAGIKKAAGKTYLHTTFYNESEYEQIVFYKNRILVIDITMLGKIGEQKIKYRKMYYGIPQQFDW
jgi:hypothetical protein